MNIVIFSVVNTALQKPIAGVRDAGGLVRVYRGSHSPLAYQDFLYFRDSVQSFSGMVAERIRGVTEERNGTVIPLQAAVVPGDYFSTLGVRPAIGRLFAGDAASSGELVVVLAYRYWQVQLGADSTVVGRTIRLNDSPFRVVGVAAPDFTSSIALWNSQLFVLPVWPVAETRVSL